MRNAVSRAGNKPDDSATVFALAASGEQVKIEAHLSKAKYYFPGGWRAIGVFEMMRILRATELTDSERIIAFWLPAIAEKSEGPSRVSLTGKRAKDELGISKYTLSRAIAKLKSMDLIRETGLRGLYELNPEYSFNGSAAQHAMAKRQWYSILDGRPRLVLPDDRVA